MPICSTMSGCVSECSSPTAGFTIRAGRTEFPTISESFWSATRMSRARCGVHRRVSGYVRPEGRRSCRLSRTGRQGEDSQGIKAKDESYGGQTQIESMNTASGICWFATARSRADFRRCGRDSHRSMMLSREGSSTGDTRCVTPPCAGTFPNWSRTSDSPDCLYPNIPCDGAMKLRDGPVLQIIIRQTRMSAPQKPDISAFHCHSESNSSARARSSATDKLSPSCR